MPGATKPTIVSIPGGITRKYMTDLSLIVERSYPKFIELYPDLAKQSYIINREANGDTKYTKNKKFYQWQPKGKNVPTLQVLATVTGGSANASATFGVAAGYYIDGGTLSPPAAGQYYFNDSSGQVIYIVSVDDSTPSTHTFVARPATLGDTISVNTADLLIFYPTIVGEKSISQATIVQNDIKVINECATIKTTKEFTDWALFETMDIPNSPQGFSKIKGRQMRNEIDLFAYQQEILLMFTKPTTNVPGVVNNHTGVIPDVQVNGQSDTSSTVINQAFFDNIRRVMDAEGRSDQYDYLMALEHRMKAENYLATTFTAGAIVYANTDAFKKAGATINRTFKGYDFHGYELFFKTYAYFNSSKYSDAAVNSGFYKYAALLLPRDAGVDPENGKMVPRFSVRYQAQNEGDPAIKFRVTGGLADTATDDTEHLVMSHVATKGIQKFGINGYMWLNPPLT